MATPLESSNFRSIHFQPKLLPSRHARLHHAFAFDAVPCLFGAKICVRRVYVGATPHRSDRPVVLVIELDQLQSCKPKHIGVVENLR